MANHNPQWTPPYDPGPGYRVCRVCLEKKPETQYRVVHGYRTNVCHGCSRARKNAGITRATTLRGKVGLTIGQITAGVDVSRTCTSCHKAKSPDQFASAGDVTRPGALRRVCKTCDNARRSAKKEQSVPALSRNPHHPGPDRDAAGPTTVVDGLFISDRETKRFARIGQQLQDANCGPAWVAGCTLSDLIRVAPFADGADWARKVKRVVKTQHPVLYPLLFPGVTLGTGPTTNGAHASKEDVRLGKADRVIVIEPDEDSFEEATSGSNVEVVDSAYPEAEVILATAPRTPTIVFEPVPVNHFVPTDGELDRETGHVDLLDAVRLANEADAAVTEAGEVVEARRAEVLAAQALLDAAHGGYEKAVADRVSALDLLREIARR